MGNKAEEIRERIEVVRGGWFKMEVAGEPLASAYYHAGEGQNEDKVVPMTPFARDTDVAGEIIDADPQMIIPHACAHIRTDDGLEPEEGGCLPGDETEPEKGGHGDDGEADLFATASNEEQMVGAPAAPQKQGWSLKHKLMVVFATILLLSGGYGAWKLSAVVAEAKPEAGQTTTLLPAPPGQNLVLPPISSSISSGVAVQPALSSARNLPAVPTALPSATGLVPRPGDVPAVAPTTSKPADKPVVKKSVVREESTTAAGKVGRDEGVKEKRKHSVKSTPKIKKAAGAAGKAIKPKDDVPTDDVLAALEKARGVK